MSYDNTAKPETSSWGDWLEDAQSGVDRTLYRLQHRGLALSTAIAYRLWSSLLRPGGMRPDATALRCLARRFERLLARDLENVERGKYPRALLYQMPLAGYLKVVPEALLEAPRILWRSYRNGYDEVPASVERDAYPRYYLRTFHWQTDGWLSARSARLYDASVEFLFGGVADVMRRMAIPPVVDAVDGARRPRVLDVGCGTGRFLLQLGRVLPDAKLYGIDLSPYYVRHARRLVRALDDVTISVENAERMPWADDHFDAVTSVFLFHELPPRTRRAVAREMHRVLKPGGRLVICDSAQVADSGELKEVLSAFPDAYHEPYFRGYLRDDLAALLEQCGLVVEDVEPHLVSKVVVARKPHANGEGQARGKSKYSTKRASRK
jgi:ubiquinone/menaquinone biosynthesis C-methylase UbiE